MFFFEKKNKKSFSVVSGSLFQQLTRCQPQRAKVFCFFFSKKKIFLALFWHPYVGRRAVYQERTAA
jgi:hypothetical protein